MFLLRKGGGPYGPVMGNYNNGGRGRCATGWRLHLQEKPGVAGRVSMRWRTVLLLAALAFGSTASIAQWSSNRGYQLLQRVDDVLFGVDNLTLRILNQRYVAGTLLHIQVDRPDPVRSRVEFVADCRKPLQFAIRPAHTSANTNADTDAALQALEFSDAALLDGSWFAAEFACESTRQPGSAAKIARDLFERGGPQDMVTIYCDLQPDGSQEMRSGVEVRYSASANAVAVNRQWLSSGTVTPEEVRFGTNSKWRIQRQALDIRRTAVHGEMLFSGRCDRRPPNQR